MAELRHKQFLGMRFRMLLSLTSVFLAFSLLVTYVFYCYLMEGLQESLSRDSASAQALFGRMQDARLQQLKTMARQQAGSGYQPLSGFTPESGLISMVLYGVNQAPLRQSSAHFPVSANSFRLWRSQFDKAVAGGRDQVLVDCSASCEMWLFMPLQVSANEDMAIAVAQYELPKLIHGYARLSGHTAMVVAGGNLRVPDIEARLLVDTHYEQSSAMLKTFRHDEAPWFFAPEGTATANGRTFWATAWPLGPGEDGLSRNVTVYSEITGHIDKLRQHVGMIVLLLGGLLLVLAVRMGLMVDKAVKRISRIHDFLACYIKDIITSSSCVRQMRGVTAFMMKLMRLTTQPSSFPRNWKS